MNMVFTTNIHLCLFWALGTITLFTGIFTKGNACSIDEVLVEPHKKCVLPCTHERLDEPVYLVRWTKSAKNGDNCYHSLPGDPALVEYDTTVQSYQEGYSMDEELSLVIMNGSKEDSEVFRCTISFQDKSRSDLQNDVKTKLVSGNGTNTVQTTSVEAVYTTEATKSQSGLRTTEKSELITGTESTGPIIGAVLGVLVISVAICSSLSYLLYVLRRRGKIKDPEKPVGGPSEQQREHDKILSNEEEENVPTLSGREQTSVYLHPPASETEERILFSHPGR